jgi:hypothetical protein
MVETYMKTATGPGKFDGVDLMEAEFHKVGDAASLLGKYALCGAEGLRVGPGQNLVWGEKTIELVKALLDSMEQDLLDMLFVEAPKDVTGAEATTGLSMPPL